VRIRGAIGVAAVAMAVVAAGFVVGRPVSHAGHGYLYSAEQARAMVEQQAVAGSEFRVTCASSHRRQDDPIVFQNQSGVSHTHEFFGNRTTDAFSTLTSLRAGTTNCDPMSDRSAYWVPALYKNGQAVAPESVTIYYQGVHDHTRAVAPPQGLRYVVGNAKAASPAENPAARDVLLRAAKESGLDVERATAVVDSDEYAAEVRERERHWQQLGINSVPAVIIDDKHLISGGQPPEVFERALRELAAVA
jgi:hypothetical protein